MLTRRTLLLGMSLAGVWAAPARADLSVLSQAFRAGGAALVLRHAVTDPGIGDPPGFRLDDCKTQRNLSAAGRIQAQSAGEVLAAADLRVDEVRSSRWCRCIDTARLMFPAREVQVLAALDSFFDDRSRESAQTATLRRYLAQLGSRNAVLVTHQVNISSLTGVSVAMGEAVVVRAANATVLGRLMIA
jgi:broad specificity phosphatase PhoE